MRVIVRLQYVLPDTMEINPQSKNTMATLRKIKILSGSTLQIIIQTFKGKVKGHFNLIQY